MCLMTLLSLFLAVLLGLAAPAETAAQPSVPLIPYPAEYSAKEGCSYEPEVLEKVRVRTGRSCSNAFRQKVRGLPPFARKEAYEISISGSGTTIQAQTAEGEFRARQTLRKLALTDSSRLCCTIFDYPRYEHRGLMLDESRSFKGKEFTKKQINAMALLGLNSLHLHLTDAAGWRIEIKSHPELTQKAAWRLGYTYAEWEKRGYPFASEDAPDAYGGYYTQDDLREIVAYAAERYIQVIPEIEMPGHSMEVNRTYPELACVDAFGHRHNFSWDLCPGNEGTFKLLEDILSEVIDIFPCKYVHIGGDEAVMKDWRSCVNCKKRMEKEGYSDVSQLQGYLVRRMASYLKSRGRTAVGWDEVLETGVPSDVVVMSWRGTAGGEKAAAAGHKVIMAPNSHCYFDYYQDLIRKEPLAVGELTSLHWVYTFDPGDDPAVLGLQANLWCEKIPTAAHAEYMLYPRLFAIAEIGWSPASRPSGVEVSGGHEGTPSGVEVFGGHEGTPSCAAVSKEQDGTPSGAEVSGGPGGTTASGRQPRNAEEFRKRARTYLDVFKALGYNTFDMDGESEFARAGLRRTQSGETIYPTF